MMESSKNKELVRSIKRAKKILSTADHVSNFADHICNPTLTPSNVRTCNNGNFTEGAHRNISVNSHSISNEMEDPSQFTKLLSEEKDRVVLKDISNCAQTGEEFHKSEHYENKLFRSLRSARRFLSATDHIVGRVPTEMPTNATDYNDENCLKSAFKDKSLDSIHKAMYGSSQFSSLLPQEKDKIVLNDISNCARNLTTKFDAAVQTGGFFFLDGYGGAGKTFLWRALTAHLRSKGQIVLCVASSGIAATLLPFGRTGHSRFAIPIAITEESTCNIKQGSLLAELVIKSSLIIWDEAPMVKKHCFEAMDRTFKDIMQKTNRELAHCPFGGKCVVLGGDFRQILPVIPGGTRSDIVFASIKSSYLWSCCQILTLTKNMRLQKDTTSDDVSELREFSEWMLKVGDGKLSEPNDGETEIEIPPDLLLKNFTDPLQALFDTTYPDFEKHFSEPDYLKERAILTPTLDVVEEVNQFIMKKLPTEEKTYLSSDSVCNDAQQFDMSSHYITPSMLNDLKISGLPNHKLTLKIGIPIMLLRNLDQSTGLCNGTRLIVTHLGDHVIGATVISGGNLGQQIFLSRMNMSPSDSRLPFKLQRRQFPISISYCMTINKSQGQSLSNVTVYLPKPVFTHGQLYVAVSRVKNKKGLKFLILDKDRCATSVTKNVVYKEIFENIV